MESSEPGRLPVAELRKCHFYSLLILDDTRPIILAVITKQNVNSLLESERETCGEMDGGEREQEGRKEGMETIICHSNVPKQTLVQVKASCCSSHVTTVDAQFRVSLMV